MPRTRPTHVARPEIAMDRRTALQGALATAGVLGLGSLTPPVATAQQGVAPVAAGGSATLTLTRFLSATRFGDLPPLAIEHAKMILASTLSSAAVGTTMDSAIIQRDLARNKAASRRARSGSATRSCRLHSPRA